SIDPSLFLPAPDEVTAKIADESARGHVLAADLRAAGCFDLDDSTEYTIGRKCYSYRQELYADSERQTAARWPNGGYDTASLFNDGETTYLPITAEQAEKWAGERIRYYGYPVYDWDGVNFGDSALRIDAEGSRIVFLRDGNYPIEGISSSTHYLYNLLPELDSPGEYYWDTEAGMLYWYPDGDINEKKISFSQVAEDLIYLGNTNYLSFEGITFENGRSGAIGGEASHLKIEGCTFRDFGGCALKLELSDALISGCSIYNMGGAGLKLSGGKEKDLTASNVVITGNLIHDLAQTYTTSNLGIDILGYGFTVSHNEIFSCPDSAIAFNAGGSVVEYNRIHEVCRETGDAGAMYTGRTWTWNGNVIRYNLLENIGDAERGNRPNGMYLDDNLSGQTVYGNIFINVAGHSILVGGGKYNRVMNNVIADPGSTAVMFDERSVGTGFAHEHIVYPGGSMWTELTNKVDYLSDMQRFAVPENLLLLENTGLSSSLLPDDPGTPAYTVVRDNILYCAYRSDIVWNDETVYLHSVCASNLVYDSDPGFTDFEGGDYSLREDSRVYRDLPGFVRIDFSRIGIGQ
ncbi:MAG: right-handed parallel beta-helix repeat-containing protein, partial [Clostridia bacterium]|nr:right-handed parallel beta-helix repeat-containing protein [Clostridia bacterium]